MKKIFLKFGAFLLSAAVILSGTSVFAESVYPEHISMTQQDIPKTSRMNIVYDNTDHGNHRTILEYVVKVAAIAENTDVWLYPMAGKEEPILVEPTQDCVGKLFTSYIKASNEMKPGNMISTALADLENTTTSTKELVLILDSDAIIANHELINELKQRSEAIRTTQYYSNCISADFMYDDFFESQLKHLGYASCDHTYDADSGIITIKKGFADRNIVVVAEKDRNDFEYISGRDLDEEYAANAKLFINGYLADKETYDKQNGKGTIKGVALSYNHINFVGAERHGSGSKETEDKAIALFTADGVTIAPATEDLVIPVTNAGTVEVYYKSSPGAGVCSAETEYNLKQQENAPLFGSTGFTEKNPVSNIFEPSTEDKNIPVTKPQKVNSGFSISNIFSFILRLIVFIISLLWRLLWLGLFIFAILLLVNKKVRSSTHLKLQNSKLAPLYKGICDWFNELKSLFAELTSTPKPSAPEPPVTKPPVTRPPAHKPPAITNIADLHKKIFISYSSADYKDQHNRIKVIKEELKRRGIECWISAEDIKGGRDFSEVLPTVIANCAMVLLFLSPNSCESEIVSIEVSRSQANHKIIFPIKIVDFDLFGQYPSWEFKLTNRQVKPVLNNKADTIKNIVDEIEELYNEIVQ